VRRNRLNQLITAGAVDSFGLAFGWTVFVLHAVASQGLVAAGLYNAAMLIGVALSAPAAAWIAGKLNGKRLLQSTAVLEAGLRVGTFALLLADVQILLLAALVIATNVVAWIGFAAMRAEIAAVADGRQARALTRYAGGVAAVEAAGAAAGAVLVVVNGGSLRETSLVALLVIYGASLLPTFLIARGSRVAKTPRTPGPSQLHRNAPTLGGGFAVMLLASGPTFLSVALAAELYGQVWVAPAAVAFTVGALLAPLAATAFAPRSRASLPPPDGVDPQLVERTRAVAVLLGCSLPAAAAGVEAVSLCNSRGWRYDRIELDRVTWYVHAYLRDEPETPHRTRLDNATLWLRHELAGPSQDRSVVSLLCSPAVLWPVLGVGIVAGWALAPRHVVGLLVAQLLSGVFLTALEGLMDTRITGGTGKASTAGLGWAAATRALGSAVAVAAAPALIGLVGLTTTSVAAAAALSAIAACALVWTIWSAERPRLLPPPRRRTQAAGLQPSV
jgi:hypothetical protein